MREKTNVYNSNAISRVALGCFTFSLWRADDSSFVHQSALDVRRDIHSTRAPTHRTAHVAIAANGCRRIPDDSSAAIGAGRRGTRRVFNRRESGCAKVLSPLNSARAVFVVRCTMTTGCAVCFVRVCIVDAGSQQRFQFDFILVRLIGVRREMRSFRSDARFRLLRWQFSRFDDQFIE